MNSKTLKLVDWLQNNTNLAQLLITYGVSTTVTENNTNGYNAAIERWLIEQLKNDSVIDDLIN